jgi:hypothetical protein
MRNNKIIQGAAVAITLGALGTIALTSAGGFPPRVDSKPHEAAGWAMARQALTLRKDGGQIVVITRDTSAFKNPAADIQLASFTKELRKAKVTISRIEALQVDPLRPVEVPPGDFLEWIRKAPEGSVIVSFMGPPLLNRAERAQLKEIKPHIVAFCSSSLPDRSHLRVLFEQGLLHAAVVSRRTPPSSAKPHGLQGWFDHAFVTVTAANVGDGSWQSMVRNNLNSP